MRRKAEYRRSPLENCGKPDVNSLSEELSAVLNITYNGDNYPERHPDSSLPSANQSPPVRTSVPDGINSSDSSPSFPAPRPGISARSYKLKYIFPSRPPPNPQKEEQNVVRRSRNLDASHPPGKRGRPCETCDLVKDVSTVTGPNGYTVNVQGNFTCESTHVIYYIYCELCNTSYVGRTSDPLRKKNERTS